MGQQHDYLRSLGADFTFDYQDENVTGKIRGVIPQGRHLRHAFDCVGIDIKILEELVEEGGTIALALPPTRLSPRHHVEMAIAGTIHDLESFNAPEFKFHDGKEPRDSRGAVTLRSIMAWTMGQVGRKYQPARVRRLSGKGMYDAFEAFELMRAKKISAEKVVWRMSETPGL